MSKRSDAQEIDYFSLVYHIFICGIYLYYFRAFLEMFILSIAGAGLRVLLMGGEVK